MKSLIRHLPKGWIPIKPNDLLVIILIAAAFSSCGKEPERTDYVAKVNNSYLTNDELDYLIDSSESKNNFYRSEIIRNWINKELLYQEAKREGILDEDEFNLVISNSEKELAASFLLNKYYENEDVEYDQSDLEEYYNQNKNNFKLLRNAYLINLIVFNDEDRAVQFRSTVLETDWEKSLTIFEDDSSIKKDEFKKFVYDYELQPVNLLKIVRELYPQELSIVISEGVRKFYLVQILEKFYEGTIPPLDIIKPQVENRLLFEKKEALIKNYIKELYSNNDINVKN